MHRRVILLVLLYCLLSINLFSQIVVNINMPELNEGMEQIEVLLYSNISSAISEMEDTVNQTLDKPELTKAFSNSTSINLLTSSVVNSSNLDKFSFSMGASLGVHSYTFDIDKLESRFMEFTPEDDIELGVNAQFITTTISIPHLLISFSYMDFTLEDYNYNNISGGINGGVSPLKEVKLNKNLLWKPLSIQGGFNYGISKLSGRAEAGVITEEFDFDLDGDGPLFFPQTVNIEIEPVVDIGLDSYIGNISLKGSSELILIDSIHLNMGGGVNFSFGETNISVKSSDEITVLGYLSGLIDTPGSVSIDGAIKGGSPTIFTGFIFSSVQIDLSSIFLNLGVLYSPLKGISGGLSWGIIY